VPHGVTSQKMAFFIVIAVTTSNVTLRHYVPPRRLITPNQTTCCRNSEDHCMNSFMFSPFTFTCCSFCLDTLRSDMVCLTCLQKFWPKSELVSAFAFCKQVQYVLQHLCSDCPLISFFLYLFYIIHYVKFKCTVLRDKKTN
jgi:hypothetical protein